MIKNILIVILITICIGCNQTKTKNFIPDGLYLIVRIDTVATEHSRLSLNEMEVFQSRLFDDYNSEGYSRMVVDTTQYAPLELEDAPKTEQQTETKKKILLSLSSEAAEKLKTFTTKHVMEMVTLVIEGEALTTHMIREPITSGQLQITRCNDNACERLFERLKDNEKHE